MSGLTTHVLDIAHGRPGADVTVELWSGDGRRLTVAVTNAHGRTDAPLLDGAALAAGPYRLVFHLGSYFARLGVRSFFDRVEVRFRVTGAEHYHVPLLAAPWGYSTYRGS